MNRLSFLRALGATLAAVPLGLMAARKSEPKPSVDLSRAIPPLYDGDFFMTPNGERITYRPLGVWEKLPEGPIAPIQCGRFEPIYHDDELVAVALRETGRPGFVTITPLCESALTAPVSEFVRYRQ